MHISITNPDRNSDLPYFRGKAEMEEHLKSLGLSYCILRPTVLFGQEDILINNIAWALRYLPAYGIFGDGRYRLQPIYVDDLAAAAVRKVHERTNETIDAIGPETFRYRELVEMIATHIGVTPRIVFMPPALAYQATRVLGWFVDDVIITREEIRGLMEERLYVELSAAGHHEAERLGAEQSPAVGLKVHQRNGPAPGSGQRVSVQLASHSSASLGISCEIAEYLTPENRERHAQLTIFNSVAWAHDRLLPKLEIRRKAASAVVHPSCSTSHLKLANKLQRSRPQWPTRQSRRRLTRVAASRATVAFSTPSLLGRTAEEAEEVRARKFDAYLGSNRTCEIGLNLATGKDYQSFLYLFEELTRPT